MGLIAKVLNTDYKEIISLIQASKDRLYIERSDGLTWYEIYVQCDTIESRFYKRGIESDIYDETNSVRFPGAKGYVYPC